MNNVMTRQWIGLDAETACNLGCTDLNACKDKKHALDFTQNRLILLGYWVSPVEFGYLSDPVEIRQFFVEHDKDLLVWQNGAFDQKVLAQHCGIWVRNDFDLRLATAMLPDRPESLELEDIAMTYLGVPHWKEPSLYLNIADQPLERTGGLCVTDCEYTVQAAKLVSSKLSEIRQLKFLLDIVMSTSNLLAKSSFFGVRVDLEKLEDYHNSVLFERKELVDQLYAEYKPIIKEYEDTILTKNKPKPPKPLKSTGIPNPEMMVKYENALIAKKSEYSFNFNSAAQVLWLLKDKLGFPCANPKYKRGTKSAKYSTGKDVLALYKGQHKIINDLLKLRYIEKQEEFCAQYKEYNRGGRLHGIYNQDVARTFRTSMKEPNLQQVPKGKMRELFIPREGYKLVDVDFAQIEPRLAAHFSQDPTLLNIFRTGQDFYSANIKFLLGLPWTPEEIYTNMKPVRNVGKTVGLGVLYGVRPDGLCSIINKGLGFYDQLPDKYKHINYSKAQEFIRSYFEKLSGLLRLQAQCISDIKHKGYIITLLGRKLFMGGKRANRVALNMLFQNSASDLAGYSQVLVNNYVEKMKLDAKYILFMHDEGLWEVHPNHIVPFTQALKYVIEVLLPQILRLTIPLKCEINVGDNWACK
jgi:DNA polymerase I-like protein with 3'-5' exonuclease and polymerase domains